MFYTPGPQDCKRAGQANPIAIPCHWDVKPNASLYFVCINHYNTELYCLFIIAQVPGIQGWPGWDWRHIIFLRQSFTIM